MKTILESPEEAQGRLLPICPEPPKQEEADLNISESSGQTEGRVCRRRHSCLLSEPFPLQVSAEVRVQHRSKPRISKTLPGGGETPSPSNFSNSSRQREGPPSVRYPPPLP